MSETEVSRKIREAVEKHLPIRLDRHHCGMAKGLHGGIMKLGREGWPDYIGYTPDGRFVGIEVKDPKGHTLKKRAEKQHERAQDIRNCGGIAVEVSSPEEALEELTKCLKNVSSATQDSVATDS